MKEQHGLERRASMLSDALLRRTELLRTMLAPPGQRPAFHDVLSKKDALDWWNRHRYDELGARMMQNMDQQDILELDNALSQANAEQQYNQPSEIGNTLGGM